MNMHEIHEYARRFLETHGAKAEAEAAQRAGTVDRRSAETVRESCKPRRRQSRDNDVDSAQQERARFVLRNRT